MEKSNHRKSVPSSSSSSSSLHSSLMRTFSRALRLAELTAAVLVLAYATRHLPGFLSCLRRVATGLLHPHFVFLLGNSIVALLLHLSRHFPSSSSSSSAAAAGGSSAAPQLYQELMMQVHESVAQPEVVFEDKETVLIEPRRFTKSKSERFEKKRRDDKLLKRSDTEVITREKTPTTKKKKGGVFDGDDDGGEEARFSVEEDEAFRKMVEEFIARQARFHRQESMEDAIVDQA